MCLCVCKCVCVYANVCVFASSYLCVLRFLSQLCLLIWFVHTLAHTRTLTCTLTLTHTHIHTHTLCLQYSYTPIRTWKGHLKVNVSHLASYSIPFMLPLPRSSHTIIIFPTLDRLLSSCAPLFVCLMLYPFWQMFWAQSSGAILWFIKWPEMKAAKCICNATMPLIGRQHKK